MVVTLDRVNVHMLLLLMTMVMMLLMLMMLMMMVTGCLEGRVGNRLNVVADGSHTN